MNWKFNKDVANNFDYIADTSIPKYRIILYKTLEIIRLRHDFNDRILEIGCATGNTLKLLNESGYNNVTGIDNSVDMIDKCRAQGFNNVFLFYHFPKSIINFDVIIANWTLHFITDVLSRVQYLTDIYDNLKEGGTFIFSEKVIGDDSEYLKFKKSNFLTEYDINCKRKALKGILVPFEEELYINILEDLGFKVEIIDKTYCFRTFLATK